MKKYLHEAIIKVDSHKYLVTILFLAPLMNFLAGISIDIYSPSMPAITSHFHTTITVTKNTVSITLLGWALGALIFGILLDSLGRKIILTLSISAFVIASLLAPLCHTIHQLMLVRLIQGFTVSAITIGCRTLVSDTIKGPRFAIAMVYISIGYGSGPIIGPFIGGLLQHYIGWQANFIALSVLGAIILFALVTFTEESIPQRQPLVIKHIANRFTSMLKHKRFVAGIFICAIGQIQLLLYPTLGPFIVEETLKKSALVYGDTALIVGGSFLTGALLSRLLLKHISPKNICYIGYAVLSTGLIMSYWFMIAYKVSLLTVMLPNIFFCTSYGLVSANLLGENLKQFPNSAGIAMAIQATLVLSIATAGTFVINSTHIAHLSQLSLLYSILALLQIATFFLYYRKIFKE